MKLTLALFITLFTFSVQVFAQSEEAPELLTRFERYYINYYLNEDGSHVESIEWATKILKERAVARTKQAHITYSTSIQKAEVIEAYTRKADGRRIDVPKSNFQLEVNSGKDKDAPVFSDLTTLTVVFPDLAVDDAIVLSYKITQIKPMFPGHFSSMAVFPRTDPYDDVKIKIDAPISLWTQYESRDLTETVTEKEGRKIIKWTFSNKQPIKNKRRNYSVYDIEKDPGFSFSTFKSYADIAEAYGVEARPKAAVTESVQKLADQITKDKKTQREQAKALYEWVAKNISYAGNCIGVGAVVPHDIPFILDNKMGDCKDHATLLQALLAAKNISSTQALVNAGSSYRLAKIPVVSMVNHVINYIPSLNLYADSTSQTIPFGMLPFLIEDKPVLLVDGFKEGIKTPISPPDANQQHMKSVFKINTDGSIIGSVDVSLKGEFAVSGRDRLRDFPKDQEEDLVKNILRNFGYVGSGKFEKEDPKELLNTYHYKANFNLDNFIQRPGAGAFYVKPLFASEAPIQRFLAAALEPEETVDSACSSGISVEEYTYQFPKNMKILSVPENMSIANDFLAYRATYKLKGNTLIVKRAFEDKTKGNVCSADVLSAYKKLTAKVLQEVKSQVVYK